MGRPAIEVKNLSKRYRLGEINARSLRDSVERLLARRRGAPREPDPADFWALKDVSFDVEPGEVLGIIGRNGAGKSTLLKILSRVTEPTAGEIRLRGRVASLLEVGTGFHPELSGRENIFLNGAVLGMTRAEIARKFDEIVDFSGVEKFLDTPVKRYSSGMYVRLAFAVAAHLEPEILIVDEVLAVGDAEFQRKCLGKMQDVSAREGRTVLLVSHNMALIQSLCHRGIVLRSGIILADAPPTEAIDLYLNAGNAAHVEGLIDLREHPDRLRGMKPCITSICIQSAAGIPAISFAQGQSIAIEISYDARAYSNTVAGAGIILQTSQGSRVGSFNTYMANAPPHTIPPYGRVSFNVEDPILNPGTYLVSCSIGEHQSRLLDKIENAASFEVRQADIYETGYLLTAEDGAVALECKVDIDGH